MFSTREVLPLVVIIAGFPSMENMEKIYNYNGEENKMRFIATGILNDKSYLLKNFFVFKKKSVIRIWFWSISFV